ncbi:MAG: type II toxin-antitoxin system prevent-host-death family antitoxin [Geminicoccaceae bacterium]
MRTFSAFDGKTRFSELLDLVEAGEEVLITRHGKPVARMVSAAAADRESVDKAIARLKEVRKGSSLGGLDWKELRDEDRP